MGRVRHSPRTAEQRFLAKIDRSGGPDACWPWLGGMVTGYGRFNVRDSDGVHRGLVAHRLMLSWQDNGGYDRPGFALHACDNRACCNPRHLWWGTQADNINDMWSKDRASYGERCPWTKIDDETVRKIRSEKTTCDEAASAYGVSRSMISRIRKRQAWRHVQ